MRIKPSSSYSLPAKPSLAKAASRVGDDDLEFQRFLAGTTTAKPINKATASSTNTKPLFGNVVPHVVASSRPAHATAPVTTKATSQM